MRASPVAWSVIFINTKTWRSPNHVSWGPGFCGDSVGTDIRPLRRDSGRDGRAVRASRPPLIVRHRQALGFDLRRAGPLP